MPNRMTTQVPTTAEPPPSSRRPAGKDEAQTGSRTLNDEQLRRWAQIVAAGEEPLPQDLEPSQTSALADRVRQLRRERLVGFIARQVALTVHRRKSAPSEAPLRTRVNL